MIDIIQTTRRDDENILSWKIRLCDNKENYSLTWDEIKELINAETGESNGESVYRKWWYSFYQGMEFSKQNTLTSEEAVIEIELKKLELIRERKKLQTVKSELNKRELNGGRKDLLLETVSSSIDKIGILSSPVFEPLEANNGKKAAILGFGDEHFGKEFISENNQYNEKIYLDRMNSLLSDTIPVIKKESLDELTVLNGADSVEGMALRVSMLTTLQYGFIDQVIKYARYKVEWLKELSKYTKIRYIHIPSANHSELRLHGSSRGEMPKEDVERIIAVYIHDMLKDNERIEVPLYDDGIVDFELLGFNIAACHGHQLKGKKNAIKDISMMRRKFYDYLYVSHFHHGSTLTVGETGTNNIEVVQLPSIMGSDEYSDTLFTGAKAGANLSIYEEGKGRTITYNFILN